MSQFDPKTPITTFLKENGADVSLLTEDAAKLTQGDLMAMMWHRDTTRTIELTVRDMNSLEKAFGTHPFHGHTAGDEIVDADTDIDIDALCTCCFVCK